jgi:hypothetical protein
LAERSNAVSTNWFSTVGGGSCKPERPEFELRRSKSFKASAAVYHALGREVS